MGEKISGENGRGQKREWFSAWTAAASRELLRDVGSQCLGAGQLPTPPGGPALGSVFMRTPGPCSKPCSELGVNRFLFLAFQRSFDSCLPVVRLEYVIPCEGGGRKLDSQTNGAAPKMTNPLRRAL